MKIAYLMGNIWQVGPVRCDKAVYDTRLAIVAGRPWIIDRGQKPPKTNAHTSATAVARLIARPR